MLPFDLHDLAMFGARALLLAGLIYGAFLVGHRAGARAERELARRVIPLTPHIRRRR